MAGLSDKRFLVTGASGFVGACLARRLVRHGADVHVFTRPTSTTWRLENILPRLKTHPVDLRQREQVREAVHHIKPHVIFHCAAYGTYHFQQDTSAVTETNFLGTLNLLEALSGTTYDCLVNTGSSSEYGPKSRPMSEADLLEPTTPYGVAKAAATLFCQAKARAERLPIVTFRLFSVYGCYEEPTRLVPYVISSCLSRRNPELSSGHFTRDFVYVGDVVDAYMTAAAAATLPPGEIINIGSGQQQSVQSVVDRVIALTGASVRPQWGKEQPRTFDTATWIADAAKAKSLLGWSAKTSLDEGLSRTIEWHRRRQDPGVSARPAPAGSTK